MSPVGLSSVTARIAQLQSRFGPLPGFSGQLAAAGAKATATATGSGSSGSTLAAASASTPAGSPANAGGAAVGLSAAGAAIAAAGARPAPALPGASAATGDWATRLPQQGQQWAGAIQQAADAAGIDPRLLAALVQAESNFNAGARSHAGAIGLGQLMPGTARELGVDPTNPQQNLQGAARYLRSQLDRFGSVDLALAAYNAGPGRVAQAGGVPRITETQNYVRRVTANYNELRSAA